MRLSSTVETFLLDWAFGGPFLPAPPEGLWLSLHSSTACDQGDQISGWAGGDRIPLQRSDFTAGDAGGLVNTRALLLGANNQSEHIEGFAVWFGPASWDQLGSGLLPEPVELKAGNPPVFYVGDLILRLR